MQTPLASRADTLRWNCERYGAGPPRSNDCGLELEPRGNKLRVRRPEPLPRHILAALHVPRSSMALRDRSGNFSEPWSWSQSSQVTPGP